MLDEWNDQISKAPGRSPQPGLSAQGDAQAPLFTLEHRLEFLSRGRGHAVAFAACNDSIFVATSRNFVLRHDTGGGSDAVAELELTKAPDARVRRLFVDPLGLHALVTLQAGSVLDTFYLDSAWKKARPVAKLRNVVVTSVAWPPTLRAASIAEVLLGTDDGSLLELSVDVAKRDKVQLLCTLRGGAGPIAGLAQLSLHQSSAPATRDNGGGPQRLILALCGTRLHLFRGGPSLPAIFASYDGGGLGAREPRSLDLPVDQPAAQLQLLGAAKVPEAEALDGAAPFLMPPPTEFAVLSPSGVYYGRLDLAAGVDDELDHLQGHKLLPAAALQRGAGERPLSMALTSHHVALLYPSRLQFVNRVSKRAVQEVPLDRFAAPVRGAAAVPLGLCRDALAGRVLVLAGDDAFEVDAPEEDRDMWRVLLDRGEFRGALPYCRTARQRNAVYLAEANAALGEGRAVEAAQLYGKCTASSPSFEDLALRLMDCGEPDALRAFLLARLGTLGRDDRAQATMVATWLLELLLDAANRAALQRGDGGGEDEAEAARGEHRAEAEAAVESAAAEAGADADVRSFLQEHVELLDPGTTVGMLAGYGREDDLLAYARARGDHEATLECLLQRGEAERALEVLRKPSVSSELAYKFAPALAALAPAQAVQSWMDASPTLDPRRLLPALLPLAEPGTPAAPRDEALRYVRYCVRRLGCSDAALHNFAVALLAADERHEPELLDHLATARDLTGQPLYDPVHALRLVREHRRPRPAVELLCELGLWEDALALALTFDRQLAASIARRPAGDDALRRKLWLALARHVVEHGAAGGGGGGMAAAEAGGEDNRAACVREVSRVLDESGGAVRIEDVLPLFPDFVEIDAFRDAICTSLERYNAEMRELRGEMALATRTAHALREDLERLDHRAAALDLAERCARCERPLHQAPPPHAGPAGGSLPRLFLFPTGNAFHGSCLCAEVSALSPAPQRERIRRLVSRLAGVPEGAATAPAVDGQLAAPVSELRQQLEEEIALEDPYCGELVARHVSKPFILPEEAVAAASWAL